MTHDYQPLHCNVTGTMVRIEVTISAEFSRLVKCYIVVVDPEHNEYLTIFGSILDNCIWAFMVAVYLDSVSIGTVIVAEYTVYTDSCRIDRHLWLWWWY